VKNGFFSKCVLFKLKTRYCEKKNRKSLETSGAMESAGALSFFFGVGGQVQCAILPPYRRRKIECVGHVQKRLGIRLRKIRNNFKGKKLVDGKILSGRGRLTDKIMNKMKNYFGMSIRQNTLGAWNGDHTKALYNMKKSAVLWHCTDIDDKDTRHMFCPRTEESWCKYWQGDKTIHRL